MLLQEAILGNVPFEIDRIGPTGGRDNTEVKNGIFPRIARPKEFYDFRVAIGTGNNERAIRGNIAL